MKPLTQINLDADVSAGLLPVNVIEKCQELLDATFIFPQQYFEILAGSPLSIETMGSTGYMDTTFNIESCRVVFFYHYDATLVHVPAYKNAIWGKVITINGFKIYYYIPFNQGYFLKRFSDYNTLEDGLEIRPYRLPPFNAGHDCYFKELPDDYEDMVDILSRINTNLLFLSGK